MSAKRVEQCRRSIEELQQRLVAHRLSHGALRVTQKPPPLPPPPSAREARNSGADADQQVPLQ